MEKKEITRVLIEQYVNSIPDEDLMGVERGVLIEILISKPDTVQQMLSLLDEV